MQMFSRNITILTAVAVFFCASSLPVFADTISIRPFLIDHNVEPRDIIADEIVLTNETDSKKIVFATVNEISVDNDGVIKEFITPVMTDRTNTVTSWVEITRGRIELEPRETRSIPITFRIHPYAEPGDYHAFIGFVPASKRPVAEATALAGDADGVVVKLTYEDEAEELLHISSFVVSRFVFGEDGRDVSIEVENNGEVTAVPEGEIIFYNSRGEEVSATIANEDNIAIPPGETKILTAHIPFYNELGRYKANVSLEYGERQRATVFDTAQFYMLPKYLIFVAFLFILLLSLLITHLLRRNMYDDAYEGGDGGDLPLYIRTDKKSESKDHDITLTNEK